MIWGVRLEPGKIHCENVSQDIHLTMAAMESWDAGDNEKSKSLVFLQVQQSEYLLCTLTGVLLQQHLDMRLTQGEKLTFSVRGKNSVYLTGYSENVTDIVSPGEVSRLEEETGWEENWMPKDDNNTEEDVTQPVWEDEADFSGRKSSHVTDPYNEDTDNTSSSPVTIKREREEDSEMNHKVEAETNSIVMRDRTSSTMDQNLLDSGTFDRDIEDEIEDECSQSPNEVNSESLIGGATMTSYYKSNSNCIPSMISSGIRLQPPVCVTTSLDLSGRLMPIPYPSPRQLLPHMAKLGVPQTDIVLPNYQTSMLAKLKLLQQSLNPSNFPIPSNHFLLPNPRLSSPNLPKRTPPAPPPPDRATKDSPNTHAAFKCPTCKRIFTHRGHFKKHVESHHGQKIESTEEFKCRYCDKIFVSKHRLRTHEHGHEGVRPYKCQICGKGFTQSGTCRRHERIHVGFKPFKCRFCNRTFLQTKDLKKHEVFHLRELMTKEVSCL